MTLARAAVLVSAVALAAVGLSGHSRKPAIDPQLQRAVGAYRFADDSVAALFIEPFGTSLRIVDYESGAMRQLVQVSRDEFVGGPRLLETSPVQLRVRLVRNSSGQIVALRRNGKRATRIALHIESVTFQSGDVRIGGKLMRPPGIGPVPTVVLVPGSVRATRDTYDLWGLFFAAHGFAVLSQDKRHRPVHRLVQRERRRAEPAATGRGRARRRGVAAAAPGHRSTADRAVGREPGWVGHCPRRLAIQ